jgi:hypothetical protein
MEVNNMAKKVKPQTKTDRRNSKLDTKTRQFALEDIKGLADLLEKGFLQPQRERLSLYVNHTPIPLISFPRQIITNTILALASSLKGVKKIKSLDIFYRKSP